MFYRIPEWTCYNDDKDSTYVQYELDIAKRVRLIVTRVPCIVTLSQVFVCKFLFIYSKIYFVDSNKFRSSSCLNFNIAYV